MSTTVTQLIQLSAEADTLEMKRRIAQSLNVVIERMDIRESCILLFMRKCIDVYLCCQIVPYVNIIADSIPSLCMHCIVVDFHPLTCSVGNSAEGDFLYKGVLLETVTTLVQVCLCTISVFRALILFIGIKGAFTCIERYHNSTDTRKPLRSGAFK